MSAKLITEKDVRDGKAVDPIVVGSGCVITPSALDCADRMGIRVIWDRSGGQAPAAKDAGAVSERRSTRVSALNLEDGEYLVQVKAGRAVVSRLTPNGRVPMEPES